MKQKTVRFYEESKSDMEAYGKLECFREYGFNNAREMIVTAVNAYSQKKMSSSGMNIDIDKLAELISKKIKENTNQISCGEDESINKMVDVEIMDKALSFIECL